MERLPLYCQGERLGEVTLSLWGPNGARTEIAASMDDPGDGLYRAFLTGEGGELALGVLAPEVHLCAAPEARQLLLRLIESCGDSYEVEVHKRTTPLICMSHAVDYQRVQPGDALITFSKVGVLSVAEDLRQSGKEPAIICSGSMRMM